MDLVLTRKERRADGVFSDLTDERGNFVATTLEHAYPIGSAWEPKIPNGAYTCQRGEHRLEGMAAPFTTFEVTGVPGHSNLLFHTGNRNADSAGCILLGHGVVGFGVAQGINFSRLTFQRFMEMQAGVDEFRLTVQG